MQGIRKLCCELLDLKDAVENLCGNRRTKYLAFLRSNKTVPIYLSMINENQVEKFLFIVLFISVE